MNIAIVGFDIEGKATYEFLSKQGHELTICDQKTDLVLPDGAASQLGESYLDDLGRFDRIVRTAGLHPAKILEKNPGVSGRITSHINLFFENTPTKNIIGITGTKGKGTTSTLVAKMLEASGKDVQLGGNIGVPPLTFLDRLTDQSWVVLELSSFQLMDLHESPHIATVLMIVPEHLNWHEDMEEYIAAKQQLFIHQSPDDIAVYFNNNDDSLSIADASEGQLIPYFTEPGAIVKDNTIQIEGNSICGIDELKLLGAHNLQNVCAAVTTAWQVTHNTEAIRQVLVSFTGLPHRLELVRELDEIAYYDDSFGTTPETAIVAIESFEQPKVVILGGSDKGASFETLADTIIKQNVRAVIYIGVTGPKIADLLKAKGFMDVCEGGKTMDSIVSAARSVAQSGDVVLLSTGCASFGLFSDYKDRGNQFIEVVKRLS